MTTEELDRKTDDCVALFKRRGSPAELSQRIKEIVDAIYVPVMAELVKRNHELAEECEHLRMAIQERR